MMMERRDPAIKLFGMKIPFPAVYESTVAIEEEEEEEVMELSGGDGGEDKPAEKVTSELVLDKNNNKCKDKSHDSKPETMDKEETTSTDQIQSSDSPEEDDNNQQTTADGKTLKKPTKILPCPRCKSMDTKFCYYNNYNINQPRHFCKACQRYWTAGGTMRNVPVGAGRRKNKSSSSHYRHITISEALEAARLDQGLQANTRVLSFGQQQHAAPMTTPVMKLNGDQKVPNGARNGFHHGLPDHQRVVARVENGDDCSSGSSVTTSVDESRAQSCRVVEPQMNNNNVNGYACIPGVPWPYTWNPAMPPPGFYPPPGYPMPFYPYWTIPMISPSPHQTTSPMSQKGSSPNSPTLGKHSRDEEKDNETERKQRILVPKTLRIDDPNEAAKSSIWTTLGIKNEGMSKGGMFKGFDHKTKRNHNDKAENSPLLSANPAALSRSLNFQERV
ncbi:unnamed protein product [Thlaspi arvense]|uniref:Dof-type domain-containing protein n=1 Tax=Thlaspi arvense TaxID=13288 RepID=A0AAU9SCD4_THLAR|nr:unnamed protein product [Thlaspi arvense]